jgi:hypothetical protein
MSKHTEARKEDIVTRDFKKLRAGGIAQVVEGLPRECEAFSTIPSAIRKKRAERKIMPLAA